MYKCKQCGENNPAEMMKNGGGGTHRSLCKKCHNLNTIKRGRENRKKYIEYKGGKCERCGYYKCSEALEFHHKDPTKKDEAFKNIRYWGLEKAKEELDKCFLVCANCHREIHWALELHGVAT
jgi:hypothetical protein